MNTLAFAKGFARVIPGYPDISILPEILNNNLLSPIFMGRKVNLNLNIGFLGIPESDHCWDIRQRHCKVGNTHAYNLHNGMPVVCK